MIYLLSLVLAYFSLPTLVGADDPVGLIVGGHPAEFGEYPSFGTPSPDNGCGATLIHEDVALTAAHCEDVFVSTSSPWYKSPYKTLQLGGILSDGSDALDTVEIVAERPHPSFVSAFQGTDLMLLKLRRASTVPTSRWNTNPFVPADGEITTVIGFGATSYGGPASDVLLEVDVPIIDFGACNRENSGRVDDALEICAGRLRDTKSRFAEGSVVYLIS